MKKAPLLLVGRSPDRNDETSRALDRENERDHIALTLGFQLPTAAPAAEAGGATAQAYASGHSKQSAAPMKPGELSPLRLTMSPLLFVGPAFTCAPTSMSPRLGLDKHGRELWGFDWLQLVHLGDSARLDAV